MELVPDPGWRPRRASPPVSASSVRGVAIPGTTVGAGWGFVSGVEALATGLCGAPR